MTENDVKNWTRRFRSALPEPWQAGFNEATEWIEKNPSRAAMIGAAAGFSLGFLGVRRIMKGVDFARRTPLFAGLAFQAASGITSKFGHKNQTVVPDDRL